MFSLCEREKGQCGRAGNLSDPNTSDMEAAKQYVQVIRGDYANA